MMQDLFGRLVLIAILQGRQHLLMIRNAFRQVAIELGLHGEESPDASREAFEHFPEQVVIRYLPNLPVELEIKFLDSGAVPLLGGLKH